MSQRRLLASTTALFSIFILLAAPASAKDSPLRSAGALEFGPDNVLFVGDTRGAAVHAFELRTGDNQSQSGVNYGRARTFEGTELVGQIDQKLAGLLGTTADNIVINDMRVHPDTKQIFLSVHRGRGPDAVPAIVTVDKSGALRLLDVAKRKHTSLAIPSVPTTETLEFGQLQREFAITDVTYYDGEIFVAGLSNEEFASTLRRAPYPFSDSLSTTTLETWHAVHGQFETRAPIITQTIRELNGEPHLIAVYACTPLVRIPLKSLTDGAHVRGEMIGELGYGNTPVDLVTYTDIMDGNEYVLVTHNSRSATRVSLDDVGSVKPMPINVSPNFGPDGIDQYSIPLTAVDQLDLISEHFAAVIRRDVNDPTRIDLDTLVMPFFFDRSDHIVEMSWPDGPDPFGYRNVSDE